MYIACPEIAAGLCIYSGLFGLLKTQNEEIRTEWMQKDYLRLESTRETV